MEGANVYNMGMRPLLPNGQDGFKEFREMGERLLNISHNLVKVRYRDLKTGAFVIVKSEWTQTTRFTSEWYRGIVMCTPTEDWNNLPEDQKEAFKIPIKCIDVGRIFDYNIHKLYRFNAEKLNYGEPDLFDL